MPGPLRGRGRALRPGVGDVHAQSDRKVGEVDPGARARCVPQHVAERLLHDPVGRQLHAGRQWSARPAAARGDGQAGGPDVVHQRVEPVEGGLRGVRGGLAPLRCVQRVRVLGAQHAQHPAQLGERLQRVLPDAGEVLLQLVRRVLDEEGGDLGLDGDHRHVVRHHVVQLARDAAALLQQGPPGPLLGGERGLLGELGAGLSAAPQGDAEDDDDREQDDGELPRRLVAHRAHHALHQVGGERAQGQRLQRHTGRRPQGEQQQDEHVADEPGRRPGPGERVAARLHRGPHGEGPHQHGRRRQPPGRNRPPEGERRRTGLGAGDHEAEARIDPAVVPELGGVAQQHPERHQVHQPVREPAQPHRRRQRVGPPGPPGGAEHAQPAPGPGP